MQQVYEERDDVDGFINQLYAGEVDLMKDEKFNSIMDTFDVLKKYNMFSNSPLTVEDDEGKTFISDTCAMISPFKSNDVECANEIGVYVKKYADAGKMTRSYDPDNHFSVLGASMQKYLADEITRQELADEIEEYWSTVEPVIHE